jgi:hypothetical protein
MTPAQLAALRDAHISAEQAHDTFSANHGWFRDPDVWFDRDEKEALADAEFDAAFERNFAESSMRALFGMLRCAILTDGARWYVVFRSEL